MTRPSLNATLWMQTSAEYQAVTREVYGTALRTLDDTVADKSPRRAFVASKYRVVMLFGDDLNDFATTKGKTLEQRDMIARDHAADWGRKWFALPNPVYGSWEQTIVSGTTGCDQIKRKMEK